MLTIKRIHRRVRLGLQSNGFFTPLCTGVPSFVYGSQRVHNLQEAKNASLYSEVIMLLPKRIT